MTRLYDRRVSVTLNGRQFEGDKHVNGKRAPGFRIAFAIEHSLEKEGNKAEVSIYNLSASSRGEVQQKYPATTTAVPFGRGLTSTVPGRSPLLILEAGYAD